MTESIALTAVPTIQDVPGVTVSQTSKPESSKSRYRELTIYSVID